MIQNTHVLARGVIISNGYILLAYDSSPIPDHYYELGKLFYYLPGGHIENKETARTSLIREIKEETGYNGECVRFLGILEHAWGFAGDEACCHTHEVNLIFEVNIRGLNNSMTILQQEEHVAFKWIKLTELNEIDFRPANLKDLILKWLKLDFNDALQTLII